LIGRLIEHGRERHAPPGGQLLRYADGRPITSRRYDHLWTRLGRQLPWVHTQQISTHWIRHTTLTWVERNFGYAVARAYAGHTDGGSETATGTPSTSPAATARTGPLWPDSSGCLRSVLVRRSHTRTLPSGPPVKSEDMPLSSQ
jgi:integrase